MPNELMTKIISIAADQIFDDLGIQTAPAIEAIGNVLCDGKYHDIAKFEINPKMAGPLAPMFKLITVEVKAGVSVRDVHLLYEYRYEHPNGGSNGYSVRKEIPFRQPGDDSPDVE